TLSIDLAGEPLTRRGYRLEPGRAPLREDLARALVILSRWDRRRPLLDPMCGSGTIAIEAALMARGAPRLPHGLPPGLDLEPLADTRRDDYLFGDADPLIIGADRDLDALIAAKDNAARAAMTGHVVWQRGDVTQLDPDDIAALAADRGKTADHGLILSNPPYGERLDDADLRLFYGALGDVCHGFRGWRGGFLVVNEEFERAFGGRPTIKKPLSNGNLRGYFFGYEF
ncbi:MAG: RNA methyltransferase, partial [Myxococcales bacterium]|nr:RNA methyltransferase [Myxococcales bacterium]